MHLTGNQQTRPAGGRACPGTGLRRPSLWEKPLEGLSSAVTRTLRPESAILREGPEAKEDVNERKARAVSVDGKMNTALPGGPRAIRAGQPRCGGAEATADAAAGQTRGQTCVPERPLCSRGGQLESDRFHRG